MRYHQKYHQNLVFVNGKYGTTWKNKARIPFTVAGFVSLMDFYGFTNGGGGGSRTRVRKGSPPVSTCLVPNLKIRAGHAVETKRAWC